MPGLSDRQGQCLGPQGWGSVWICKGWLEAEVHRSWLGIGMDPEAESLMASVGTGFIED